ncbi:MAG: glycosyl hydrolase [Mucilaginibacter sp.]|uniref:glycosyl hydrolase n=1 Tax=Mucilaginibacter sp. TaxID=1882438 RepID=UPI0031A6C5A7
MLLKRTITCFCFLMLLFLGAVKAQVSFRWGINGHPLTQFDYSKNTWDQQISFLKDLKLNTYRIDVPLNPQGLPKNETAFQNILDKLNSNSITPFPVLIISGLSGLNAEQVYTLCNSQGKAFGLKYGKNLPYLEVGNEEDNKIIVSGNGTKASDYDADKASRVIAKLKGFIDGLKSVQPDVKVSLSFSWVHFYYLEMLKQNNVNYDIVGCHWYSNMGGGDITNANQFGNVLKTVKDRFNKDIWITEFNYWKGTKNSDYTKQADYLGKSLKAIVSSNLVKGFFIYELFDQNFISQRSKDEASYGILSKDASTADYQKKDIYLVYKSFINANVNASSR